MTAAQMIWTAAGCPTFEHADMNAKGRCWWCLSEVVTGRSVATMPGTFLDALGTRAGDLSATHLCAACAWTLSDAVKLPVSVGGPLLARALDGAGAPHPGRVSVSVGEESPGRRLVLRLDEGLVGVWERPGREADERVWVGCRWSLRHDPVDKPAASYLGAFLEAHLSERVGGKFRNFIPFATASGRWEMWTKADRAAIRDVVVHPPLEPWTLAIGDGQKHAAIHAMVSDGRRPVQSVYYDGVMVSYRPLGMRMLVEAMETLILAGYSREEVETGRFQERGTNARRELVVGGRQHRLADHRGSSLFDLALFLLRPTAEIRGVE